jgi:hypothetical protein
MESLSAGRVNPCHPVESGWNISRDFVDQEASLRSQPMWIKLSRGTECILNGVFGKYLRRRQGDPTGLVPVVKGIGG